MPAAAADETRQQEDDVERLIGGGAQAELGVIPKDAPAKIRKKADFDIERIDGFAECAGARRRVADPRFQEHLAALRAAPLVDYEGGPTACEGLEGAVVERTYAIAKQHVDSIVLVEEEQVMRAIAFAYRVLGLVVEPSAAVVLAAVQSGRVMAEDDTALIVTGAAFTDTGIIGRSDLNQYRILHFATHGLTTAPRPAFTFFASMAKTRLTSASALASPSVS